MTASRPVVVITASILLLSCMLASVVLVRRVDQMRTAATLEEVRAAMRIVAVRNHVIAEGAGACAVAAGLTGKCGSGKVVCVVSGGNIDISVFTELVKQDS